MAKLIDIEGIGEAYAKKLAGAGLKTTEALLKAGKTAKDRLAISERTGIDKGKILEWVNRADLFRVKGIGTQYSDLLEASGVDSVLELSKRNVENLYAKLVETNAARKLVNQLPAKKLIAEWIEQAKALGRGYES